MGHDKLQNVFKSNFALMQHHHWNLEYLETLLPWERYIYIELLQQHLEELEKERQLLEQERKSEIARIQRQQNMRR